MDTVIVIVAKGVQKWTTCSGKKRNGIVFTVMIGGISISLEAIDAAIAALGTRLITIGKLIKAQKKKEEKGNDEKQLCHEYQDSDSRQERIGHRENNSPKTVKKENAYCNI